jgi:hypothetical protein
MPTYQDIREDLGPDGLIILHVSDDENHITMIPAAVADAAIEPFEHPCGECGNDKHRWRRVLVIA